MASAAVEKIRAAMTDEDRGGSAGVVGEVAAITPFGGVELAPDGPQVAFAEWETRTRALIERMAAVDRGLAAGVDALAASAAQVERQEEVLLEAGRDVLELAELVSSAAIRIGDLLTPAEVKVVDVIRDEAGRIASAICRMEERPSALLEAVRSGSFEAEIAELLERAERAAE